MFHKWVKPNKHIAWNLDIIKIKERQQIICDDCGAIFEELAPEQEKKFEKAHEQG